MRRFFLGAWMEFAEGAWCAEVVLAALLSKFRFAPSDKEIVWEMSGIAIPTVKGSPRVQKMPLVVTAL